MSYDSRPDTLAHIGQVRKLMFQAVADLLKRADVHDKSKLKDPELSVFDEHTPQNQHELTYGSEEYDAHREKMKEGLEHHYALNRHHPEHHEQGFAGMNLLDLIEMLADWKAASARHKDGSLAKSLDIQRQRYRYDAGMDALLRNTARDLGWL